VVSPSLSAVTCLKPYVMPSQEEVDKEVERVEQVRKFGKHGEYAKKTKKIEVAAKEAVASGSS
jgi:hypothetical protein